MKTVSILLNEMVRFFTARSATNKNLIIFLIAALIPFGFACDGDEGAVGPAGPKGDKGDTGAQGPQGVSGNANVIMYEYGAKTFTGSVEYLMTDLSKNRADSSMIIAFYNPEGGNATAWYGIPSLGPENAYITTHNWYQSSTNPSTYTMNVTLFTPGGVEYSSNVTFTKFRIFVTKASAILPGGRVKNLNPQEAGIDLTDHDVLCEYLGMSKE